MNVPANADTTGILVQSDGGVRIGGEERLAAIAAHMAIRERFPLLASACEQEANSMGKELTLATELQQRPTCAYFVRNVPCYKTGSPACPALTGENRALSILEGGPCWIVNPSELGVALVALDAMIEIESPSGSRVVSAD